MKKRSLLKEIAISIIKYEDDEDLFFLKDFPPIYPLLDFVEAYIGDASSIGYDMLTFNKPLFFTSKHPAPIHNCGILVDKFADIFVKKEETLGVERENLYLHTFGNEVEWKEFEKELTEACFKELDTMI